MTNPNNAVGTNGAFGGRTSVNAFNDDLASYSAGILSGWACEPDTGLTVVLGGDGNTRDVAIAEDNAGNKTTINNISGSPISVTIGAAPASNSRIDSIVAYVDNPPNGSSTITDNYEPCGLIVVAGTPAVNPVAPNESAIRTAITADGASGTTAYYVVLANVTIASGTTDLTNDSITVGDIAQIGSYNIDFTTFPGKTFSPVTVTDTKTIGSTWTDYGTYTVPATGLYMAKLHIDSDAISTNHNSQARLFNNGTEIQAFIVWGVEAWSGNYFCVGNDTWVFWLEQGDVLTLQGKNNNATVGLTLRLNLQQIY